MVNMDNTTTCSTENFVMSRKNSEAAENLNMHGTDESDIEITVSPNSIFKTELFVHENNTTDVLCDSNSINDLHDEQAEDSAFDEKLVEEDDENDELNTVSQSNSILEPNLSASVSEAYVCLICQKEIKKKLKFKQHLLVHSGKDPYTCCFCMKEFDKELNLKRHLDIHMATKIFTCQFCFKKFNKKCNLQRHIKVHTGQKDFLCKICTKGFIERNKLIIHMNVHHPEHTGHLPGPPKPYKRPYKCEVCLKQFRYRMGFENHYRIHTGEKPFTCDFCGKSYIEKSKLSGHIKKKHLPENMRPIEHRPFVCGICGKDFKYNSDCQRHFSIHFQEKRKCDLCGREYKGEKAFKHHMQKHTEGIIFKKVTKQKPKSKKKFKCSLCDEDFLLKKDMNQHKKDVHKVETIFTCNYCGKTFTKRYLMVKHMNIHEKTTVFTCKICQKEFNRSENLCRHMRIHNGEKPYLCDICGVSFCDKSGLTQHIKVHTEGKLYNCPDCGKGFRCTSSYKGHIRKHSENFLSNLPGIEKKSNSSDTEED